MSENRSLLGAVLTLLAIVGAAGASLWRWISPRSALHASQREGTPARRSSVHDPQRVSDGAIPRGDTDADKRIEVAADDLEATDTDGRTRLLGAAEVDDAETICSLLAAGVNLDVRDKYGDSALHRAAGRGYTNAVHTLLTGGADPNAMNRYKDTPLHRAAWRGHTEAFRVLLAHGANPNMQNALGRTAFDSAAEGGYAGTIGALLLGQSRPQEVYDKEYTSMPRNKATFVEAERKRQEEFRISNGLSVPTDSRGRAFGHLLALGQEQENLYTSLRGENGACRFFKDFKERKIKWWQDSKNGDNSKGERPTRNMASSQIACVNFVLPLISIPGALTAMLRAVDNDVTGVVEIVHTNMRTSVEIEWIGLVHALEGADVNTRGAYSTSVDAFIVAETTNVRRAYLLEWKYVEAYHGKDLGDGKRGYTRRCRYAERYEKLRSFSGIVPLDAWLFDPFYQIMRLRLLADRMIDESELGVHEAKVVVVVPEANRAYRDKVTSPWLADAFPDRNVSEVVRKTLLCPERDYAVVSQSTLANAVRAQCSDAVASWSAYHRDRYGW